MPIIKRHAFQKILILFEFINSVLNVRNELLLHYFAVWYSVYIRPIDKTL